MLVLYRPLRAVEHTKSAEHRVRETVPDRKLPLRSNEKPKRRGEEEIRNLVESVKPIKVKESLALRRRY